MTGSFSNGRLRSASGDGQHLMHSYDVEATGLSELAEDSDEDSGSGLKRTSFEDANGQRATQTSGGGGGAYDPPRRVQSERVSTAGQKSFGR